MDFNRNHSNIPYSICKLTGHSMLKNKQSKPGIIALRISKLSKMQTRIGHGSVLSPLHQQSITLSGGYLHA